MTLLIARLEATPGVDRKPRLRERARSALGICARNLEKSARSGNFFVIRLILFPDRDGFGLSAWRRGRDNRGWRIEDCLAARRSRVQCAAQRDRRPRASIKAFPRRP